MKSFLFVLLSFFFQVAIAQVQQDDLGDDFGGGHREFEFEHFDDQSILLAINRDARIACNKAGLCQISSVTSRDHRFTATFMVGQGNMWGAGMGGAGNAGGGTNIIIPGGNGFFSNEPFYSLSLRYTVGRCTQTVNVPRSVYYAINRYMYGLLTEEGGTRRGFTPADEAMIMFYTTIMKQATGCIAAQ